MATTIRRVAVLGCGLMGSGIAEACALAGYPTIVREVSQELLEKGLARLRSSVERGVQKGRLEQRAGEEALARVSGAIEIDGLNECDLFIEAIIENLEEKRAMFRALEAVAKPEALFASNTSSITLTQLAAVTSRPDRFLGLHFFNPVGSMKLVEVVRTLLTSETAFEQAWAFADSLGKEPIACRDNSGFIVNRLLVPFLLDAVRAYEEGVGSLEDIDKAMRLGCSHPMGPFTLLDFIGLDTALFIAEIMYEEYREKRFAPPPLLKQMVHAGRLGRKSGRGFFDYQEGAKR
jgi:3-hydroxybutyryl-CoA dehydrogenase